MKRDNGYFHLRRAARGFTRAGQSPHTQSREFCIMKRISRIGLLLMLVLLAGRSWGAQYYTKMGVERILLMNNDNKTLGPITGQGYNTTDPAGAYYWVHTGSASSSAVYAKAGTNHVYWASNGTVDTEDDTRLWELKNCRAGSATVTGNASRNYLPWTATCVSITDDKTVKLSPTDSKSGRQIGSVILRNVKDAAVYSPYYPEGIGTIYFDTVNAYVNNTVTPVLKLQMATGTVNGDDFNTISNNYENCNWQDVPFDVLSVEGAVSLATTAQDKSVVTWVGTNVTELALDVTAGESKKFYRVRARINVYEPARFRIVRTTYAAGSNADTTMLVLVDSILCSFPPCGAFIHQYGEEYDSRLKGKSVLGRRNDFTEPFLYANETNVLPRAYCTVFTNSTATRPVTIENALFNYRWTYLNQVTSDWRTIAFSVVSRTQLVAKTALDLTDGVGDLEYYYTADVDASFYQPQNYTFVKTLAKGGFGYGADGAVWGEKIDFSQLRGDYKMATPTGNSDFFARIREGASDWERVDLMVQHFADTNLVTSNVVMELTGDHTWRTYYPVPTNRVGEEIKFYFRGLNRQVSGATQVVTNSTDWKISMDALPYVPYNGRATEDGAYACAITLDDAATHLLFEFNDEEHTFSVSHTAFQNFDLWTDAVNGFVGYYQNETYVSEQKQSWVATFFDWDISTGTNEWWSETFDLTHEEAEIYPVDTAYTGVSKNRGWQIENGMFVSQTYTNKWSYDSVKKTWYCQGLGLQMQGCGRGVFTLANLASGDVPPGVDTVSFTARAAQFATFNDFYVASDRSSEQNYALSAKAMMSTMKDGSDMSPASPSLSLVAYYRPGRGAYELRIRRTETYTVELTLWKWKARGTTMTAEQLPLGSGLWYKTISPILSASANNLQSSHFFTGGKDDEYANWQNILFGCYTTGTMAGMQSVHLYARVYGTRNGVPIEDDTGKYLVLEYDDEDPVCVKGACGVGATDCPASFGNLKIHAMAQKTLTTVPAGESVMAELAAGDWGAGNPGRMAPMLYSEGDQKAETWIYGVQSVPPAQTITLYTKNHDETGSGYAVWGTTNVTSFQSETITFSPGLANDALVQLRLGGEEGEPRTDVVIDDVNVTSFRGDTYPNLGHDNGEQSQFVYTSCWIEDLLSAPPGSYEIKSVGDEEWVYIFKKAGSYTFVPSTDMEVRRALVLGGGGAGGWTIAGGGGGGGFTEMSNIVFTAGEPVTISVGAGGDNHFADVNSANGSYWRRGENGGNSMLVWGTSSLTGYGGGGGGQWNTGSGGEQYGNSGASGGGSANGTAVRAKGTQGGRGGRSNGEAPGGGGGAGGNGEDGISRVTTSYGQAGRGGDGRMSDITGENVWYGPGGGGGGGNSVRGTDGKTGGGAGGKGGVDGKDTGGHGGNYCENAYYTARNGTDGLGGGGGGGSHSSSMGNVGGRGGSGAVILRMRLASRLCTIQPRRTRTTEPSGIRSPYLHNGLGMFTFAYSFADRNANLLLQIATNTPVTGLRSATMDLATTAESGPWTTLTNISFATCTDEELVQGVKTFYLNLRAPAKGVIRLISDPAVVAAAATNDMSYGKVTITKAICYDEPPWDPRSWFGCNLWMNGWYEEKPGRRAFLYDSLYGLSCAINWSGLEEDNKPDPAKGVPGFAPTELETQYDHDDPYVQSPALANGVGQVQFRARMFDPQQSGDSVVTLYGSPNPSGRSSDGVKWDAITNFTVTCPTYQTFVWKTLSDSGYKAIRLSVKGAAKGRSEAGVVQPPAQRLMIDEVSVSEAVEPRVAFQQAYAFRSNLQNVTNVIADITSPDEQPITGESFGVQVQIVPQQLAEEMDAKSVRVFLHYYTGSKSNWGYETWKDLEGAVLNAELDCVDRTNLIFRSTYNHPESVIPPIEKGGTVVQYWLTCTFNDAETNAHVQAISSKDWSNPAWYWPVDLNKEYGQNYQNFCPYTLIDSVSPRRAWINEVNVFDGYVDYVNMGKTNQFLEIAAPAGADLTGWYVQVARGNYTYPSFGVLTMLGYNGVKPSATRNMTNHYSFVVLQSEMTKNAKRFADTDGEWDSKVYDADENEIVSNQGMLTESYPWAFQLVRPSGVIEHQIVFAGTNYGYRTPEMFVDYLRDASEGSGWIMSGWDGDAGALGVRKSHGEYGEYPNDKALDCWKNGLALSPGRINPGQEIDPNYYLQPNGTNLWIYAMVTGRHVWQLFGDGEPTQETRIIVLPKGHSTNLVYNVDGWNQISSFTVNDVEQPAMIGAKGQKIVYPVTDLQESVTVKVDDAPEDGLSKFGLTKDNRYTDAVLDWLRRKWPMGTSEDIHLAEVWPMVYIPSLVTNLTLTEMYILDIPACEKDWVLVAGMGGMEKGGKPTITYTNYTDAAGNKCSNVCMTAFMMITNKTTDTTSPNYGYAEPPRTLQGLAPGSSSAASGTWSGSWTSATFKVTGALQNGKVNGKFMPLRWYYFGPNSFRPKGAEGAFTADLMVVDPFSTSSPAYNYGWHDYRDTGTMIFYRWRFDGDGPGINTAELLETK